MNQNIQTGNKPSSPSQSNLNLPLGLYFLMPPFLPSQGVLSRQQRSSISTHKPIIFLSHSCQHQVSNQPTSLHGMEHGFPTAIPAPTSISGHKQAKPPALWGSVPLSLPYGEGINSLLVQSNCGSLLGRLSGKRIKQKYTSFVAPPLMSTSWHGIPVPRNRWQKQNSKDL